MRRLAFSPLLALVVMTISGPAAATDLYPTPSSVKWMPGPPSLPRGVRMAVLSGDPAKPGPFVIRLKLPANYAIPAHHHPTAENVTVIAGALFAGMGNKLKKDSSRPVVSGGFVTMPAEMDHYVWTNQSTVIQVEAEGPFTMTYVNPADDPSNR